jgi:hypothetical protein
MKNTIILFTLLTFSISCQKDDSNSSSNTIDCGTHNGKQLYKGPQGGCYYINDSGNKTYVDASECNC